ncbi:MAG: nitroreductase family protein [Deltaproteobacteria bacterium]|jgi:nitroreductase|nr:nitroreductase family protein [Deltaproteobacteria bacterium]
MADFLELANARQSCRAYTGEKVAHEQLVKCVEAARLTPSACNSQPWSVVVVEDPKIVPQVAETTMQLGLNAYTKDASAFFVVIEERAKLMPGIAKLVDGQMFAKGDVGGFVLSLTLEAASLGLGTCILGLFDRPKLRELLDIPEEKSIFLVIAVGHPKKDAHRDKLRKPLEEVARFV